MTLVKKKKSEWDSLSSSLLPKPGHQGDWRGRDLVARRFLRPGNSLWDKEVGRGCLCPQDCLIHFSDEQNWCQKVPQLYPAALFLMKGAGFAWFRG